GVRTSKRAHRAVPGRRVRRRLPAKGEGRGGADRRDGAKSSGGDRALRQDGSHRGRQDLRDHRGRGGPHPHRRARRARALRGETAMPKAKDVLGFAKDKQAVMVDLKFMDFVGLWQHFTIPVLELTEAVFDEGLGFDGSSIRGWAPIHASDMLVVPDPDSAVMDPFMKDPTLSLICNIVDPITKEPYSRDPRFIAQKAERYLKSSGIGDTAYYGPEAEFFIFDGISYDSGP